MSRVSKFKEPSARTFMLSESFQECGQTTYFKILPKFFPTGGGGQEVNFTQDNSLVITARVALGMMPVINAKVMYAQERGYINTNVK